MHRYVERQVEAMINHYTKTRFRVRAPGGPIVSFEDLSVVYLEQEVIEGVHGPLPVSPATLKEFTVTGKFAEATLYYEKVNWPPRKYNFVVVVGLNQLRQSEEGTKLIDAVVLLYEKKRILSQEADSYKYKGQLLPYLANDLSCSFNVTILRALELVHICPSPTASANQKQTYTDKVIEAMKTQQFFPKIAPSLAELKEDMKFPFQENFYPGYVYDALASLI